MAVSDKQTIKLEGFPGGVDNTSNEYAVDAEFLRQAENVELTDDGKIRRRQGYEQVYAGTNVHGFFANDDLMLVADSGTLYRLYPDGATEPLVSGLTPNRVAFAEAAGSVYWSDGVRTGWLIGGDVPSSWGLPLPPIPSVSAAVGGALPEGVYTVGLAFESGPGVRSGVNILPGVQVPSGGRITIPALPSASDVSRVIVYLSEPGGEVLYEAGWGYPGASFVLSTPARGPVAEYILHDPPPPGEMIEPFNGRMYIADGQVLWYTPPLNYHLVDKANGFYMFPSEIKVLIAVQDTLFVVADKTYALVGSDPENVKLVVAHDHTGVKYTGALVPSSALSLEGVSGVVAMWYGERSPMLGLPGGQVMLLADKFAAGKYEEGATLFKQQDGASTLLTSLSRKDQDAPVAVGDSVSTTVIRNGITI